MVCSVNNRFSIFSVYHKLSVFSIQKIKIYQYSLTNVIKYGTIGYIKNGDILCKDAFGVILKIQNI